MARIFAIAWVLVGLVITSIFTGVVTTSLTAITLSTDVKLYGTKVGSSLARNAIISWAQLFNSWLRYHWLLNRYPVSGKVHYAFHWILIYLVDSVTNN